MLTKYIKIIIIAVFVLTVLIGAWDGALAQGIIPKESKGPGGYNLDDLVVLAVKIANLILGIVGSLALLFFIYGGFTFILSGGKAETISRGKLILTNAIIGLIIVFASYLIIQFALTALGVEGIRGNNWAEIGSGWFK